MINQLKNNIILKSGTDFKDISLNKVKIYPKKQVEESFNQSQQKEINQHHEEYRDIDVIINQENKISYSIKLDKLDKIIEYEIQHHVINKEINVDETTEKIVEYYQSKVRAAFSEKIGELYKPIDATFKNIRSQSNELSIFIVNLLYSSDTCLINSGTISYDSIIEKGEITEAFQLKFR